MPYRMIAAVMVALFALAGPAQAGPYSDKLGACMNSGLIDQDRVTFAQWLVVLLAAHPDLKEMTVVSNDQRLDAHRKMAEIFVKLLSETCRAEVIEAVKFEGPAAMQTAGQLFGQFAMQGFSANSEVVKEASTFGNMVDQSKLEFLRSMVPN